MAPTADRSRTIRPLAAERTASTKHVTAELAGPLDRAVRGLFGLSWGKARTWARSGKVRVDGAVVTEPTARVRAGARLEVDESARRRRTQELEDGDVVYADAQVIVVAKPAGVSTVPFGDPRDGGKGMRGRAADSGGAAEDDTLDARVRHWLERRRLVPRGARPALGIVHRLDKETSGLLVFTRTWQAKQSLAGQFRRHTVQRRYLAIAHGEVRGGTFKSFLLADRGDGLRGSARGSPQRTSSDAREAITHVAPVERVAGATLVECRLETGRTHQIRIHLSESGHPLVGERVYVRGFPGPLIAAPRLMLHAAELAFVHPTTEREMRWALPLPNDMRAVIERLRATPSR
jgi:23S rRNA pseudouridine1911/1915/1917 synthase